MKKYDCVFSIGEACLCAGLLNKLGLRHFSAPFDWVYGATFEERVKMLLNEFDNFLNKEDLEFQGQRDEPEPCDIYYNKRTQITLNHDFPLNTPLDTSFPKVKAKYNRRINNLLSKIKKSKNVLIVFMELADSDKKVSSNEKLISLTNEINQKFKDVNIDILYIKHNETLADGEFTLTELNKNVSLGVCFNCNRSSNVPGNLKNIQPLFKDVYCREQIVNFIKFKIYKFGRKCLKLIYRKKAKYTRICGIKVKKNNNFNLASQMIKKAF